MSHERSVFFTVLPAAKSGILAGVVLGIGRAIGETMAVVMVAETRPGCRWNLLRSQDNHREYRIGNGICHGSAQRSADRHGCGAVCLYPAD